MARRNHDFLSMFYLFPSQVKFVLYSSCIQSWALFCIIADCCELYHDFGLGPKVMEGVRMGKLYKLSIDIVLPSSTPDIIPSSSDNPSITLVITTNLTLWNNRMTHASIYVIYIP